MATCIVSIAAFTLGYAISAWVLVSDQRRGLFVLWMATLARLAFAPNRLFRDLRSHQGPAFFTLPAGSCLDPLVTTSHKSRHMTSRKRLQRGAQQTVTMDPGYHRRSWSSGRALGLHCGRRYRQRLSPPTP